MAEAIESMSQAELRQEVQRSRSQRAYTKVKEKAAAMQLVEKGTAATIAVGVGALEAYKPDLAQGFGGLGYLNPIFAGAGFVGMLMTKGMAKEASSGAFLAGAVPLLNKLGAKITESIG